MKKILLFITGLILSTAAFASTVHLNNGKEVSGTVLEKNDRSLKIDSGGVQMTYYMDEIKDIDGVPVTMSIVKKPLEPAKVIPVITKTVNVDPTKKRELIFKFIDVFGTRTAMARNFDSMLEVLSQQKPEDAKKIKERFKIDEVIERLIPLYDKYFTIDELQAYIDFYGSDKGKKLVSSIGLVMKDSIEVGSVYLKEKFPEMANK